MGLRRSVPRAGPSVVLLVVAVAAVTAAGASPARARVADTVILNQTVAEDPVGDAGGGADISSLTITTYSDGTVSFVVTFANRDRLHADESAELVIDVDDEGGVDVRVTVPGNGAPSYLSGERIVRQLPEVVQSDGSFSLRLRLGELTDVAGVPFGIPQIGVDPTGRPLGPSLGVEVLSWSAYGSVASDFLIGLLPFGFVEHEIDPAASPPPATTTTTTTTTTAPEPPPPGLDPGKTVLLGRRTTTSDCALGPLPDRRCSPGAYSAGLTRAVLCSATFDAGSVGHVPESVQRRVEVEYGLAPKAYGRAFELDHVVPLELGGSDDIANLYPERAKLPGGAPGFHVKDRLEQRLHALVCAGTIGLRSAQRQIAADWERLYRKVFGAAPRS